MNSQETAQLKQFLESLTSANGVSKVPDADQLIRQAVARQPDAAYLLVQRCMLLERGLAQAKAQIRELEEVQAPSRSFLDGGSQPTAPARSPPTSSAPYAPAVPGAPVYGQPAYGASPTMGPGAGSFLGQAAATAAGVAGGAFLFEGLEHMFGHSQPGFGSEGFIPAPNENVTVNNYYEGQSGNRDDFVDDDEAIDDDSVPDDDASPDDDAGFDDDPSSDAGSSWT